MRVSQFGHRPIGALDEHGRLRPASRLRIGSLRRLQWMPGDCRLCSRRSIENGLKASGLPLQSKRRLTCGIRPRGAPRGCRKVGERLQLRADHGAVASTWSAAAIA
jgi:hypothetical protein